MKLFVVTGTCGSGKSTIVKVLKGILSVEDFICLDTDELGINWWDYSGTDYEYKFSDDCIKKAVEIAGKRNIVFATCLNPQDYFEKQTVPPEIDATFFIALSAETCEIEKRLKERPEERGFTSDEIIKPHLDYNKWFIKNKNKFNLFIDNTNKSINSVRDEISDFILRQTK